ncbi:hypothetical protein Tco_0005977 [Tanacetum coccineum]
MGGVSQAALAALNNMINKLVYPCSAARRYNYHGKHLWKTVLSWRTVECKFKGKITVVILVRDRCPRGKVLEAKGCLCLILGHVEQLEDDEERL